MELSDLTPLVEALLFVSDEPITVNALVKAVDDEAVGQNEIKAALEGLAARYDEEGRGIQLIRFGKGWQVVTRERYAPWVDGLVSGRKKQRLSRAALETAAVIAYKQPISRIEVERVRGVDAGGVVNTLLERGLIMIKGRDSGPGRPLLYGTTQTFLEYFGLAKLSDLPRLEELTAMAKREEVDTWDEAELLRFEKHGVDLDAVPAPYDASGEEEEAPPEAAGENAAQPDREADRADFQDVVHELAEDGFEEETPGSSSQGAPGSSYELDEASGDEDLDDAGDHEPHRTVPG